MIAVTAAIIINDEGKVLVCRRPENPGKLYGGLWEFPGGKIERGETPRECLERELYEELGVKAEVGKVYDVVCDWGEKEILLIFMLVRIVSGEITPAEHSEVRFAAPSELNGLGFCPSDTFIASKLAKEDFGRLYKWNS